MVSTFQFSNEAVYRVLCSLVHAELKAVNPELDVAESITRWTPQSRLDENDLGVDSIARMAIVAAVNRFFHLFETGLEDNLLRYRPLEKWVEVVQKAWSIHPTHTVSFATSGSTGTPKQCPHRLEALLQEADAWAKHFAGCRRIVALAPCHHIYGFLWTVLLPARLNVPVVDARALGPGSLSAFLEPGDLLVSFPVYWDYLGRSGVRFPPGVAGVTSTAPCRREIIDGVLETGLLQMTEIYGSSETAGIGWREDPEDAYTLLPYWQVQGAETPTPQLCRTAGEDGNEDGGQPLPFPDYITWETARTFRVAGRRDAAVQVGGINVFPERVAGVLRSHAWVRDCTVRFADATERLKALIVLEDDVPPTSETRRELTQWLQGQLSPPERPQALTFAPQLPRNEQGKLTDWQEGTEEEVMTLEEQFTP